MPHPLEHIIEVKCQTNGDKKPSGAIEDACDELLSHIDTMEQSFKEAIMRYRGTAAPGASLNPEFAATAVGHARLQY